MLYLLMNFFTFIFPFLFSFEKRIRYYRKWPALFVSILSVGGFFIVWDAIATARGHWAFNDEFLIGFRILGLPLEEILFFITVPYSCIFIYEVTLRYIGDKKVFFNRNLCLALSLLLFMLALLNFGQEYTFIVLLVTSLFLLLSSLRFPSLLSSRLYWLFIAYTVFLFFVFNYVLTSMPVVTYSPLHIWNIRITTIPLEDFLYNFSMLSLYLSVYLLLKKRLSLN